MPHRASLLFTLLLLFPVLASPALDVYLNGQLWDSLHPEELTERMSEGEEIPVRDILPLTATVFRIEIEGSETRLMLTGREAEEFLASGKLTGSGKKDFRLVFGTRTLDAPRFLYIKGDLLATEGSPVTVWLGAPDPWLEQEVIEFCRRHHLVPLITLHPGAVNDLWAVAGKSELPDLVILNTAQLAEVYRILPEQKTNTDPLIKSHLELLTTGGILRAVPLYYTIPFVMGEPPALQTDPQELAGPETWKADVRDFYIVWPFIAYHPGSGELSVRVLLNHLKDDIKDGRLILPGPQRTTNPAREILYSDKATQDTRPRAPLTSYRYRGSPLKPLALPVLASAGTPRGIGGRLLEWLTGSGAQGAIDTSRGFFPARTDVLPEETKRETGLEESVILPPSPWLLSWRDYWTKTSRLVFSGRMTTEEFMERSPEQD